MESNAMTQVKRTCPEGYEWVDFTFQSAQNISDDCSQFFVQPQIVNIAFSEQMIEPQGKFYTEISLTE